MPRLLRQAKTYLIAAVLIFGFFKAIDWMAEYLWFEALGYDGVFWRLRALKVGLLLFAFGLVLAFLWINFRILAAQLDWDAVSRDLMFRTSGKAGKGPVPPLNAVPRPGQDQSWTFGIPGPLMLLATAAALVLGFIFYSHWDSLLRFLWSQSYGQAEPVLGRDIGFYLFELPMYELLQDGLLTTTLITSAFLLLIYLYAGILKLSWTQGVEAPPGVSRHLAVNLALFLVALTWGFYLDRFGLLQSTRGTVYGAGYSDVHIALPALWIAMGITIGLAGALLIPGIFRQGGMALVTLFGYVAIIIIANVLAPALAQKFVVEPTELELERPYLEHNIAFTRQAYGLDRVEERSYGALQGLTLSALARNRETIDNIRLWDWRPLSEAFRQLQQIRPYYEFGDVDVDRYRMGGAYRQVMLATRELSDDLPGNADTWLNRRLQYTHGYGLAMSLTAKKDEQGGPILIVKDLPPRSEDGLSVTEPAIYYGETMSGYRIVGTSVPEFTYPKGDENVYTSYRGGGGISLESFWTRLLFAWHQFDPNIVITSYTTPDSRIQIWRAVRDRVRRVAPFLRLDDDPYPVLSDGKLYWIQDAYTISSWFPYAEPHGRFNYIRNSVKVVVDAYEGDLAFYVVDADDPVLRAYRQAVPALFAPLAEMPEGLRRHVRYPPDLFAAQVAIYSTYHMTVPQVFYNGEDLWAVPWEKYGGETIPMKPYYVLMRLPGEAELQFLLMTPLTPSNRDNMIAWMAARSDFPDYGELIVYKLPKERLILGPIQVEATLDQDTLISQQLSLWDQRGSRVIRGNLLVIPIDQTFIYVEPVYLIAEGRNIPQLKRVIVSNGERLAMEPTLGEALAAVLGGKRLPSVAEASPSQDDGRLSKARDALAAAEEALRDSDWERFGQAMEELKRHLGE